MLSELNGYIIIFTVWDLVMAHTNFSFLRRPDLFKNSGFVFLLYNWLCVINLVRLQYVGL